MSRPRLALAALLGLRLFGGGPSAAAGEDNPNLVLVPLAALSQEEKRLDKIIAAEGPESSPLLFRRNGATLHWGTQEWDAPTGQKLSGSALFVASTPDLKFTAYRQGDDAIGIWDHAEGKDIQVVKLPKDTYNFYAAALSPDGRLLAAAGNTSKRFLGKYTFDDYLILWDAQSGRELKRLSQDQATDLAFSPDGRLLAASFEYNGGAAVWDADTKEERLRLATGSYTKAVAFSPDGKILATGGWGQEVVLWDLATGNPIQSLRCPSYVEAVAFSPDGNILASGGHGKTLILWDARTGAKIKALEGHQGGGFFGDAVARLAFSPDGKVLASADGKAILLWKDKSLKRVFDEVSFADKTVIAIADSSGDLEKERDAKIAALRAPRGEFETSAEYEARLGAAPQAEAGLREEYDRKLAAVAARTREEMARDNEKLRREFDEQKAPRHAVELTPVVGRYDADRGGYPGEIGGEKFFARVPREKAMELSKSTHPFLVSGLVRYYNGQKAELLDAVLRRGPEWSFPVGPFSAEAAAQAAKTPPEPVIAAISLEEPSGDGILDSGESGLVKLGVKNAGRGPAFGLNLRLEAEGAPAGLGFSARTFVGSLNPGQEKSLEVAIAGLEDLKSGEGRLKATLEEPGGFDSKPLILSFKTREFLAPKLEAAKVEILDADGGRVIARGKESSVTLTVQNSGRGPARGVSVGISSGDGEVKLFGEARVLLGTLAPGESKKAAFSFAVTRRYAGAAALPVSFAIDEERARFSSQPEIALTLDREAPDVKVVRVSARETAPAADDLEAPPSPPETAKVLGESDFAVVIGIERYQNVPKSDFSYGDAKLVKSYLAALGLPERNIEFLYDDRATFSALAKSLETWLENRVKKDGRVIVYYSGHGSPDPASGEAYLVPYDGDPNYLAQTAYPLRKLYAGLGRLPASEVIVLLDSCFSGAGGRSVLAKGARPLVMMKDAGVLPPHMAVLAATEGAQISTSAPDKGHGVFTYYLLKSLKDGKKDLAEIYSYLKPRVEDEAKALNVSQTPNLLPGPERVKGRFKLLR